MTVLGLSQEWKSEVTAPDRSGKLGKISWSAVQQICTHHGHDFLHGGAQAVRCGVILRDRSGQLDNVCSQKVANSTNFVMGSDATQFVTKINAQAVKDRIECPPLQECWRLWRWMQLHSWERIFRTIEIPLWTQQISHWRKCSIYLQNWWANRKRLTMWTRFMGTFIHGNICHWLVTKPLSIFNARKFTSSQIMCCVLDGSINIQCPTNLGKQG